MACLYGARLPNHEKGIVQKCDFCMERVTMGKEPHCVKTCHQRARIFGNLDDRTSEVYRMVNRDPVTRLLPELGTEPYAFYILD
jgi:Fe-S-cluster-containing dehydrogenase component